MFKKLGKVALWVFGGLISVSIVSAAVSPTSPQENTATNTEFASQQEIVQDAAPTTTQEVEPEFAVTGDDEVEEKTELPSPAATAITTTTNTETTVVTPTYVAPTTTTETTSVNTYINSDGDEIQSPTYYDSAPAGASAQCKDGTYSFSQNRRGTCSGHGGVNAWL